MSTIRFGIIGAGYQADAWMAPALNKSNKCELVAVYARNPEKARDFARRHQVDRWTCDWRQMLEYDDMDAVYIATPPYLHAEQTYACAQAGKHVLCEKPMAMSLSECDQMIDSCQQAGVQLGICFGMRFHPVYQKMKNLVQGGFLGLARAAEARIMFQAPDGINPESFRYRPELGGGGAVMDLGVHLFDLLQYLLSSEIVSVQAFTDHDPSVFPSDCTTAISLCLKNNVIAPVMVSFQIPCSGTNRVSLYGSQGSLFSMFDSKSSELNLVSAAADGEHTVLVGKKDLYVEMVDAFAELINARESDIANGWDGRQVQQVAQAVYSSIQSGQVVNLS